MYRTSAANANADALSQLPVDAANFADYDEIAPAFIHAVSFSSLTLSSAFVAAGTHKDPVKFKALDYTVGGWPNVARSEELYLHFSQQSELTQEDGCLLWGHRVIVPGAMHNEVLKELHTMHLGISGMKNLARCNVWWPGLAGNIETFAKTCGVCQMLANLSPAAPVIPWQWPVQPLV